MIIFYFLNNDLPLNFSVIAVADIMASDDLTTDIALKVTELLEKHDRYDHSLQFSRSGQVWGHTPERRVAASTL